MEGGQRETERGEIEEREGLSMTPTLKVWVSIVLVSCHHAGVKTGVTPLECSDQAFLEKICFILNPTCPAR